MTERIDHLWTDDAACRGHDPEMWFPVGNTADAPDRKRAEEAVAICVTCPVRLECARHALSLGRVYGIWAGFRVDPDRLPGSKRALTNYVKEAGGAPAPLTVTCVECGDDFEQSPKWRTQKCHACMYDLVDADEARAHLIALSRDLQFTVIAELTGADRHALSEIARGRRRRIKTALSARILALRVGEAAHA